MRPFKFLAMAAFATVTAAAALADLVHLQDFFAVPAQSNQQVEMLCVVAGPEAAGKMCMILENGVVPVANRVLLPGPNFIPVPQHWATSYTATGPEIEGRSVLTSGVGLN